MWIALLGACQWAATTDEVEVEVPRTGVESRNSSHCTKVTESEVGSLSSSDQPAFDLRR